MCEQQLKLLISKNNEEKTEEIECDSSEDEEEQVDVRKDHNSSHLNAEESSESEDDHLQIDLQEDIGIKI